MGDVTYTNGTSTIFSGCIQNDQLCSVGLIHTEINYTLKLTKCCSTNLCNAPDSTTLTTIPATATSTKKSNEAVPMAFATNKYTLILFLLAEDFLVNF